MKRSSNIPPSSYWWLPRLWVPERDHKSPESWAVWFLIHTCNIFRSIWSLQIVGVILVLVKTCSSRFLWSGSSITHLHIQMSRSIWRLEIVGVIMVAVELVWAGSCGWAIRSLHTYNEGYQSEACRLLGVIIVLVKLVRAGSCGWAVRSLHTHNDVNLTIDRVLVVQS